MILYFVFFYAYSFDAGANSSYNPAFGLAVNTYYIGLADHNNKIYNFYLPDPAIHTSAYFASLIWVYMIFPFLGALIGLFLFKSLMLKKGVWFLIS